MKLADKIIKLRKINGWSQEELAEKLGVSRQAVSRWEGSTAQPDASNVLNLSKLFDVTADYLLNDDYESDLDVPVVRETEIEAKDKIKRVIGLSIAVFGLIGNFVIYVLSRFTEVMIPRITHENGQKMYNWIGEMTGHSYKYFVQEYDLEFLIVFFLGVFVLGLLTAFVPKEKIKKFFSKFRNKQRNRYKSESIDNDER